MPKRFICSCGMAFSAGAVRPGRKVVCPACGGTDARDENEPTGPISRETPWRRAAPRPEAQAQSEPPTGDLGRPTMRCPACGALNSADDPVCGLCGVRLGLGGRFGAGDAPERGPERAAPPAGSLRESEGPEGLLDLLVMSGEDSEPADAPPSSEGAATEVSDGDLQAALAGEERPREHVRYEGRLRVPMVPLVLRLLVRPRREMETLVSFLSYRDMVWKLLGLFIVGVLGLWLSGRRFPELPIVSGFTFGARMPLRAAWSVWLGMAFSAAAFITAGLTFLSAVAGLLTGHGWHLSPLALAFMFVVSLVNAAHLLLLPAALLGETAVMILAWGLLAWEVVLTIFVVNKVLDCDPILSLIIAVVICGVTVHFYNRVYRLTEHVIPGQARIDVSVPVREG